MDDTEADKQKEVIHKGIVAGIVLCQNDKISNNVTIAFQIFPAVCNIILRVAYTSTTGTCLSQCQPFTSPNCPLTMHIPNSQTDYCSCTYMHTWPIQCYPPEN